MGQDVEPQRVIAYLDAEIGMFREEQTRGGWSHFAALSALGASLWLATDVWRTEQPSLTLSGIVIVVASLLIDAAVSLRAIAAARGHDGTVRFIERSRCVPSAAETAAQFLRALVVACAALTNWSGEMTTPFWLVCLFTLIPILQAPFAWWLAMPAPGQVTAKGKIRPGFVFAAGWVPLVVAGWLAWDFATLVPLDPPAAAAAAARFGGAITIAMLLLVRVAREDGSASAGMMLAGLRRDIILGRLAPTDALRRAELALHGLDADNAFRPRLDAAFRLRDEIHEAAVTLALRVSPFAPSRTPGAVVGSIPMGLARDAWRELMRLWELRERLRNEVSAVESPIVGTRWILHGHGPTPHPLVEAARSAATDADAAILVAQDLVAEATGTSPTPTGSNAVT